MKRIAIPLAPSPKDHPLMKAKAKPKSKSKKRGKK
jgi:hypothetical protein